MTEANFSSQRPQPPRLWQTNARIDEAHAEARVAMVAKAFEDTVSTKSDMELMEALMLAAFSNAINRMLIAQLAIAGLLFAALKLF
ncbi:MAG: hypothetical protein OXS35_08810 [Dehalococcoidia bacterium]|nr:hypothetical protein [Dehalococcoidia bacterium]